MKNYSKDFYSVAKYIYFFNSSKNPDKKCITIFTNVLSFATIDNNNNNCFLRIPHSEGSCDTEDWSNDAENTALITGINYI